jgi:hypothetical protein
MLRAFGRSFGTPADLKEELIMGSCATYRLYLLNFTTELHRTIASSDDSSGLFHADYQAFQIHINAVWLAATKEWFWDGQVSSPYTHLRELLVEMYGKPWDDPDTH